MVALLAGLLGIGMLAAVALLLSPGTNSSPSTAPGLATDAAELTPAERAAVPVPPPPDAPPRLALAEKRNSSGTETTPASTAQDPLVAQEQVLRPENKSLDAARRMAQQNRKELSEDDLAELARMMEQYDRLQQKLERDRQALEERIFKDRVRDRRYDEAFLQDRAFISSGTTVLESKGRGQSNDAVVLEDLINGKRTRVTITRSEYAELFAILDKLGPLAQERVAAINEFFRTR